MQRILLIRVTALGDVLLATPLLRALRLASPDAHIDWLVHGNLMPLLTENPHLTRAIAATPGGHRKLGEHRYDLILDLQNKPATAWLRTRLLPRRTLVLRKRKLGRALRSLWGREVPERGPGAVERNLTLADALGIARDGELLDFRLPQIGRLEAAPLLSRSRAAPIGLAPGGRWATKRWPHYLALGRQLAAAGHPLVLLGGPEEAELIEALRAGLGHACLGDTRLLSVAGLAATIASCLAIVTNDSGPAHLAAAVGTPGLVLFGPTSPARWAPPGRLVKVLSHALPCSPCSNHGSAHCPLGTHACLRDLGPEEVLQALPEAWLRRQREPG